MFNHIQVITMPHDDAASIRDEAIHLVHDALTNVFPRIANAPTNVAPELDDQGFNTGMTFDFNGRTFRIAVSEVVPVPDLEQLMHDIQKVRPQTFVFPDDPPTPTLVKLIEGGTTTCQPRPNAP